MSKVYIDELLDSVDEAAVFNLPVSWTQGRTIYGGLSAALLLRAMENQVDSSKSLRALNIAFSAPTLPDEDFVIETELLREGKTIAQWQARLIQKGVVCVQAQAVFGMPIESELDIRTFSPPVIGTRESAQSYQTDFQPGFTQYFDMFQSQGDLPLSGGESLSLGGFMRFKQAPRKTGVCHLVAAIDVWPPASMMQMKALKAGSTVNWTMQFPQPLPELPPSTFFSYQANIEYSQNGFGITHAKVWNEHGQLLALSQQTIIVYG